MARGKNDHPDWYIELGLSSLASAYYAREFDTVEINNSFYRLPSLEAFEAWRQQAPPGLLYAVKASRYLTHLKKLQDPEEPLQKFFARANRLGNTLGAVLYQLPPHWHVNLSRLESFLSALPKSYTHVIEFRDPSWLCDEVFRLMERYQVAHCIFEMACVSQHRQNCFDHDPHILGAAIESPSRSWKLDGSNDLRRSIYPALNSRSKL